MAEIIGIDLGTSSTRIYVQSKKAVIFDEPTCLSIDIKTDQIVNIGYLAFKSLGRTPYGIEVEFPMKEGVVADIQSAYQLIDQVFQNRGKKRMLRGASFYVSAPNQMTNVEKNALIDVFKKIGAREIILQPCGKLAALGAGYDVNSPTGTIILDIGGGISDCGAVSMGDIVVAHSTKVGGKEFDHVIERYIKNKKNLDIGPRASEQVKARIASVNPKAENQFYEVSGRNISTGLPSTAIISTAELYPLLRQLINQIEDNVKEVIQDIPSEMVGDIVKSGIILTGGGSQIAGMKETLQSDLKIPVNQIKDPSNAVILGLAKMIEQE